MITKIQSLITQVETLIRKNNEILDATGSRFNIFRVLGVNHYENTHSAILAELLNPKGSHAMGTKFLDKFLEKIEFQGFLDTGKAKVVTEMHCGESGRIDIVIESCGKAIIIENKIYASDQWKQLLRYKTYAQKQYNGNFKIIYLTLEKDNPSENSANGVEYTNITYHTHIIAWLEQCVMLAANYPIVRETVNQYINHIKKLTNQDMSKQLNKEVIDLLFKNVEVSLMISESIEAVKERIIIDCAKKLAGSCYFIEERCAAMKIFILYKNYYIMLGNDGNHKNHGNVYASVRNKNLVEKGELNKNEPIWSETFLNYSAKEWNPYGSTYLDFSFYENSTLIELTDERSPKFIKLQEWVDKMKNYIDTLPVL